MTNIAIPEPDYIRNIPDIFLCLGPKRMYQTRCRSYWDKLSRKNITPQSKVKPRVTYISCTELDRNRERRIEAEIYSSTEFYIVADDDCLPGPEFDLIKVCEILRSKPFAILSLMPSNANINEWLPEDYRTYNDDEVMEHVSVGGVRVVRSGIMKSGMWPPMEEGYPGYDRLHCMRLRELGWRVGYFTDITMEHLGEGNSTLWETYK